MKTTTEYGRLTVRFHHVSAHSFFSLHVTFQLRTLQIPCVTARLSSLYHLTYGARSTGKMKTPPVFRIASLNLLAMQF